MKRTIGFLLACFLMLFGQACGEANGLQAGLVSESWSWEANAVCTLAGSIHTGADGLKNATLKLVAETKPETDNSGKIVFTAVNGNKVKLRRQSDTFLIEEAEGNGDVPVSVSWFMPEEILSEARIRLSVIGSDGETLISTELTQTNDQAAISGPWRIPFDLNRIILILTVLAAVIWGAAVLRIILNKKRRRTDYADL